MNMNVDQTGSDNFATRINKRGPGRFFFDQSAILDKEIPYFVNAVYRINDPSALDM
jgi:hypothetical protein